MRSPDNFSARVELPGRQMVPELDRARALPIRGRRASAGAASLAAAVTLLARLVGFAAGWWSADLHGGCLADVYNTANLLPNVLFEVVAGGALAGAVVPVLAPAVARGTDRAAVDRTVSALLTWSVALLVPVSVIAALAARPLIRLFLGLGHCPACRACRRGSVRMLAGATCAVVLLRRGGRSLRRVAGASPVPCRGRAAPPVSSIVVIGSPVWPVAWLAG